MKKYATFDRIGRGNEGLLGECFGGNQKYRRTSDWYHHADDVTAALEDKDREIADLRARLAAVRERCEANNWLGTARVCGEVKA